MNNDKRKKKLVYNSISSLALQLVTIVCAFILPKLYMLYYGSSVNGVITSVSQFIGFISLLDLGLGAVVRSSLYKPLADKDNILVSKIVKSSKKFFNKIALVLIIYLVILIFVYPKINDEFSFSYTSSLIAILATSLLSEYFFGITYRFLLTADQKLYVINIIQIGTLILSTLISVILIRQNFSIQLVKLFSASALLMRPLLFTLYVNKHYKIDKNVVLTSEPIKQKWNGVANHVAYFVTNNTDVIVLTTFTTLSDVSVYATYNLVVSGVTKIINSMFQGVQSLFGNMLARNEMKALNKRFEQFEWGIHTTVTFFFSSTAVLIVPFVKVYTKGIFDANYNVPNFAYLLTLAIGIFCLRIPYNVMVGAAGHYKQTQLGAILEAVINILLSVFLVYKFGLIGVAAGTAIAMSFRTVYQAVYLTKNIINYKFKYFIKHILVDAVTVTIVIYISRFISLDSSNYLEWIIDAIIVSAVSFFTVVIFSTIFYKKYTVSLITRIKKKLRKGDL